MIGLYPIFSVKQSFKHPHFSEIHLEIVIIITAGFGTYLPTTAIFINNLHAIFPKFLTSLMGITVDAFAAFYSIAQIIF